MGEEETHKKEILHHIERARDGDPISKLKEAEDRLGKASIRMSLYDAKLDMLDARDLYSKVAFICKDAFEELQEAINKLNDWSADTNEDDGKLPPVFDEEINF